MGRLLVAVLVGEGIWNVIVSLTNNVIVPWLGDVMGQSSGLPTSFTQRPYDYPDLFVAIIELCLAGLVAVAINAFFQKPRRVKIKVQKRVVSPASVAPTQVVPVVTNPPPAPAVVPRTDVPVAPVVAPRPVPAAVPVSPPPVVTQPPPAPVRPAPMVEAKPAAVVQPQPPVLTPKPVAPPAPIPAAAKPAPPTPPAKVKPKKVYYNSVGEAIEFDDD
jgi:large-conductance mechanosensitive channel